MIEYLHGTLLELNDGHALVNVGGVGYGLSVSGATSRALGAPGSEAVLWVRTYVREDTLRLFGFATRYEREVFDVFLGLSGVGPAIGLAILSTLSIGEIVQATLAGDSARFKAVKGIGPKMAEKLVLELKGKAKRLAASLPPEERAEAASTAEADLPTEAAADAMAALVALDVRPPQARKAILIALENLGAAAGVAELVREGLKFRR